MRYVLDDYFDWLYYKATNGKRSKSYRKLLRALHEIEFEYILDRDANRATDGVNLRWYYVDDGGQDDILDWKEPCTVLEMMVALCMHMEIIMGEDECYSLSHWFAMMLDNLNLGDMYDNRFNREYMYERVYIFMNREYDPDGFGNIIYIPECRDDLRDVEIWYHMCWYLDSVM